ncbi:MATE family efflux transporter [Clostridium chauvoei]|uniref:Multidrug export protein MepA n=2 Tax=Clostridium chauvoei TaxID=46867 RepID=S6F2B7_9CLOT|nr:MATE family efflux transporter [Clostridium chauvoei]ATD53820.1 MATE family efflux transporter [Clostridium chauvoei]ATD58374.1 MATE family efflux transporter [Clostridium chauvoei]MBX7280422.1 MATE family efflux transporter [Clostridium chauvoei]MBX7282907.1 MATE family efflux transporter [Clostridium chauvoei]MBX7285313.1 MATE family efflux transporter [Clostridium chauvoei]
MNRQERLGEEKISKLLITFSVPAIIGMLVNTLYNIVDRMFIGHIPEVGQLAITGVGVTMPIATIILGFGLLLGVGTSARVSLNLGRGHKDDAEKLIGNSLALSIIISIVIVIIGLMFSNKLLRVFGASDSTIGYAQDYINIIYFGTIFNLMGFSLNHSIRSDGNPRIEMFSMLIGAITNIVLDPIFIFGLNLGVKGAAIATVISQLVSCIWVISYFTTGKSYIKLRKENLKLEKRIVLAIVTIGMSPFSMQIAQSMVQVIANNSLRIYGGDLAIGSMAIIASITMIFAMPIIGLNQGAQPIIGYNYGAKKYHRVKETVTYGTIIATIIMIIGFLLVELFPHILISMFNKDPKLVDIATNGLRIYLCMIPFIGFQIVSSSYFQAIGKAKVSMFLSLLRQVILLIPFMIILPRVVNPALNGIWIAGAASDLLSAIITGILFYTSVRKLKEVPEIN